MQDYKNVQRWADMLLERPAVQRGRMVNRLSARPRASCTSGMTPSDFETKTQDKITATS